MTKKKEDNRDIFDKVLDDVQFYLPAAGVVAGGIAGRKLSRMAHKARTGRAAEELREIEKIPDDQFRYGSAQKQDEADEAFRAARKPYKKSGVRMGAAIGGIAGYGASDTLANSRNRRK